MSTFRFLEATCLVVLFIVLLMEAVNKNTDTDTTTKDTHTDTVVIVADCDEIFTLGDAKMKETVFQGDKMITVLSAAKKNFSFTRKNNGCWKFIGGNNDRQQKKERTKTE